MAQRTDSIAVMTCGLLVRYPSKSLETATSKGVLLPHAYRNDRRVSGEEAQTL